MISNEEKFGTPTPKHFETPEYRRMTPPPVPVPAERASEYLTISVAEYHFLTKAATLLEVVLNADWLNREHVVEAARKTVDDMLQAVGEGAEK